MTRTAVSRVLMVLTPALLITAIATGLVGASRAHGASAGEKSAANPGCLTDDLTGTVAGRNRRAHSGVRDAVLQLTNTSGRTCTVQGWADIALVTPPGELVRVPTRKDGRAGDEIVLEPQASAWSRVQWDTCETSREGCGVGVALQFIVDPDSTGAVADLTAVPEADRAGITMTAMRVDPLQPARPTD